MWYVFSERMVIIWNEEKKHMKCIQDPLSVDYLYTKKGYVRKGRIHLPMFRCARGTTLLDLHLARLVHKFLWYTLLGLSQGHLLVIFTSRHISLGAWLSGIRPEHWPQLSRNLVCLTYNLPAKYVGLAAYIFTIFTNCIRWISLVSLSPAVSNYCYTILLLAAM